MNEKYIPLAVDRQVELVVNPDKVRKENNTVDISDSFSSMLGKKLVGLKYKSAGEAEVLFEACKCVFTNDYELAGSDNVTAIVAIKK